MDLEIALIAVGPKRGCDAKESKEKKRKIKKDCCAVKGDREGRKEEVWRREVTKGEPGRDRERALSLLPTARKATQR